MSKKIYITESQLDKIAEATTGKYALNEAFKSNQLRDFFQRHNGVCNGYKQYSLGDFSDDQIGYFEEFDWRSDALEKMHQLKADEKYSGNRSDYDKKYLFKIYTANDGAAALVGIDRDTIETGVYWGGNENEKKVNDRLWRNGWNYKVRDNRYADDSDTYYYKSPAQDFGISTSDDYKWRLGDINNAARRMSPEKYKEWRDQRAKRVPEYVQDNYPFRKDDLNRKRARNKY